MAYRIVLDSNFSDYSTDLEYKFTLVQNVRGGLERSFTTITNQEPDAARHFGFQPGEKNPRLRWILFDDGEDRSNGSYEASSIDDARITSTDGSGNTIVKTVFEQLVWLQYYIADNTSDPRWRLYGNRYSDPDGDGFDEGTRVVLKNVRTPPTSDRPFSIRGQMQLKFGVTV